MYQMGLLVFTFAAYEGVKAFIRHRRRQRGRRHAGMTSTVSAGTGGKASSNSIDVSEDEDSSSDDDEDGKSLIGSEAPANGGIHHHVLQIGPDGRPTSGLVRERLTVRDGRMNDSEINQYLSTLLDHLKERTKHHLGYPYNLSFRSDNLVPFLQYSINNLGDPFVASNYGVHSRDFEIAVLDFFAEMYNITRNDYWGCGCFDFRGG